MRCAFFSLGSVSSKWTYEELKKYFVEVEFYNIKEIEILLDGKNSKILAGGKQIDKNFDCVYIKGSYRYATALRALSEAFYGRAYQPIHPQSFDVGHDKILTHLVLDKADIPMPKTFLFSNYTSVKSFLKNAEYPLIVKLPKGTQGKGVIFVESHAAASSLLDVLSHLKQPFLIQEYVETGGVDYRLLVIGNEVFGYKRMAQSEEKRANVHLGGNVEKIEITEELKSIALRTAKAINADICAIDVLPTYKGPRVIEVNLSPGLQGATKATGVNLAGVIAKQLYEKTKNFKERLTKRNNNLFSELGINLDNPENKVEIISEFEFKGNNIILPRYISKLCKFQPAKNYKFVIEKNKLIISDEEA